VLAHGAGAGMRHRFMEAISTALAGRGVASFRFQFPYMEQGWRSPNPRPVLIATVRAPSRRPPASPELSRSSPAAARWAAA
jgi:predicted alpha/beta-hydrolase family hydrolase